MVEPTATVNPATHSHAITNLVLSMVDGQAGALMVTVLLHVEVV